MGFWGKNPIEKAIDVVGNVADKGLSIWDNADFTAQERGKLFNELLEKTKSQATSISRRHLLWFIMAISASTLFIAVIYNALGMTSRLDGLIKIVEVWKASWAFVAAVSFYYLTQFSGASK